MSECPTFDYLLVVPRLRVQNANAISSPLTHGFPAITAFIGLMWALERKTQSLGLDLRFNAVSVVAHHCEEQVDDSGFIKTFNLTRNPIDKDGSTAAIVEEGRIHLDISLIFAVQSQALDDPQVAQRMAEQVRDVLGGMRIAGGSVVPAQVPRWRQRPYVVVQTGEAWARRERFNEIKLRLLPGFVLVERQDLLETRLQWLRENEPEATCIDAWLSLSRINWRWRHAPESEPSSADAADAPAGQAHAETGWHHDREGIGWIVPIPLGYGALGDVQPPGSVANARDRQVPFRFVESLYGIGQWLSPHRLSEAEQLLWYADSQPEDGLYRCRNDYTTPVFSSAGDTVSNVN